MRRALLVAALLSAAAPALAAPTLIVTQPAVDPETGELEVIAGGIGEGGRTLKVTSFELVGDGKKMGPPRAAEGFYEWAQAQAEANAGFKSPLSMGLVYLWVQGVPPGVLDGIHAFFRRVPARTNIHPVIYGRLRAEARARLTPANISRLDEATHLDGDRPNMAAGVKAALGELAADPSPLKVLLLITDGRDYDDNTGEPSDLDALGRQVRTAGVKLLIVSYPPPEADAAQAAKNLRDLRDAAGAFHRPVERPEELENVLEGLGQAIGDLQRLRFAVPASWKMMGGTHKVAVRLTADGRQLGTDAVRVSVKGGAGIVWIVLLVLAVLGGAGAAVFLVLRRRRAGGGGDDDDDRMPVLEAVHELVRRGVAPDRAVVELSRSFPDTVGTLAEIEPELLTDPKFPYFRTRAGRRRLEEIQQLLADDGNEEARLGNELAEVLAGAISDRAAPEKAAATITASVPADQWSAFARLDLDDLAKALTVSGGKFPALKTPRARGAALAIQDALRSQGRSAAPPPASAAASTGVGMVGLAVAWLVRAAGPGRRGETLRLATGRTAIGRGPSCQIRLDADPGVSDEHAIVVEMGGEFSISPSGGAVTVEGQPISAPCVLSDGEAIQLGAGQFVFKCVSEVAFAARISRVTGGQQQQRPARAR